ncbi:ExbD/TolR family protein [Haloferula sp. A504]|uniref:ExbD/TolR family protein n=1 Tax=Haloferula sp. A504 TaxID=3373601 RepID=UPI0031C19A2F|nr:biopolymer transporter ExbD [Verrucomicrobiaceae bacterium E54]
MRFERPAPRPRQVPIVSLIDILFIVLIFFIVSSEFKKKRDVLKIELPTVREVESMTIADARSVLAIDADGALRLDDLTVPSLGLLEAYLTAYVKENPARKLELEADKDVSLEKLVLIWDALTAAGIEVTDVPARIALPAEEP